MRTDGLVIRTGLAAAAVALLVAATSTAASAQIFHKRSLNEIASKAGGIKTPQPSETPAPSETEAPAGSTFDYKRALAIIESAVRRDIEANKKDITLRKEMKRDRWRLAECAFNLGDYDTAIEALEDTMKQDRNNWTIRNGELQELLIKCYYLDKGERAARDQIRDLKKKYEDDAATVTKIEAMDVRIKEYQRAQQMIDDRFAQLQKSPGASTCWDIVNLYADSGSAAAVPNMRKRRVWLIAVREWFPEYGIVANGQVDLFLAQLYSDSGEYHKAKEAFLAIREKYKDSDLLKQRADTIADAIARCDQAIEDYK